MKNKTEAPHKKGQKKGMNKNSGVVTAQMRAAKGRRRGAGGKFISKVKRSSSSVAVDKGAGSSDVLAGVKSNNLKTFKRAYTSRKKNISGADMELGEVEPTVTDDELVIDSDDEDTIYIFPDECGLQDNSQRANDPSKVVSEKNAKLSPSAAASSRSGAKDNKPVILELLTLDCDSVNAESASVDGTMGPPPSTPFTSLKNSVSRPGRCLTTHHQHSVYC